VVYGQNGDGTTERHPKRHKMIQCTQTKGMTRIRLQELFMLEEKGTRGHSLTLAKVRCTRDCWRHFFSNRVINRWNRLDWQTVWASSLNVFKTRLSMIRKITAFSLPGQFAPRSESANSTLANLLPETFAPRSEMAQKLATKKI